MGFWVLGCGSGFSLSPCSDPCWPLCTPLRRQSHSHQTLLLQTFCMKAPPLHESSEEPLFLPVLYNKRDGLCISSHILSEFMGSVLYDFLLLTPERIPCPFWKVSCCSCIFACYFPCGGNRLRHHDCQSMLIVMGVWFYKENTVFHLGSVQCRFIPVNDTSRSPPTLSHAKFHLRCLQL